MPEVSGHIIDDYEIISLLGKGGMAEVYHARQHLAGRVQRDVALKLMTTELSGRAEFVSRFEHEAEMQMSLSHPYILKAFDYGKHDDTVYLVTELLSGGTLVDRIKQGPLSIDQISKWIEQIAPALDYAHSQKIIHCDLKPQNVLLDAGENAFLSDFGISRLISDIANANAEDERSVVGTPAYMAPEQWSGDPVNEQTDLYALGAMLFEMITGRVPFVGDSAYQVMRQHLYNPPPSAQIIRPGLPAAIDYVLNKALSKKPDERYQSAGALIADFKAVLRRFDRTVVLSELPVPEAEKPTKGPVVATQQIQLPLNNVSHQTHIQTAVEKLVSPTEVLHPPISPPNVKHLKPLARFVRESLGELYWSPGKQHLALIGGTRIWLHRVDMLDSEALIIDGHPVTITTVAFSPDDEILASGSLDAIIRLWNVASGTLISELMSHTAAVTSLAYSADGKILASSSDDGTIRLWDVHNQQCLAVLSGHSERITTITFSPNGAMLVSTSDDGAMQVWAIQT